MHKHNIHVLELWFRLLVFEENGDKFVGSNPAASERKKGLKSRDGHINSLFISVPFHLQLLEVVNSFCSSQLE